MSERTDTERMEAYEEMARSGIKPGVLYDPEDGFQGWEWANVLYSTLREAIDAAMDSEPAAPVSGVKAVRCPKCVEEGQKSTLHGGGGITTCMGTQSYFDEEGNPHHHDPNSTTSSLRCSRGHSVVIVSYRTCPSCDNNKGRDRVEVR